MHDTQIDWWKVALAVALGGDGSVAANDLQALCPTVAKARA